MAEIRISKTEARALLAELMQEMTIIAPVSNGTNVDYLPTERADAICMDDQLPYKSPKEYFFPQCEKILTFKDGEAVAEMPARPVLLFGVKPCDLEALAILKKIFTTGKFGDPFFEAHLDHTLIIGTSCISEKPGCFCGQRETDLSFSTHCDLFLSDEGETYTVAYLSEKGKRALQPLLSALESFENPAQAARQPQEETLSIAASEKALFEQVDWETAAAICQGCGLCTYICPTCHCFRFKDVDQGNEASRYRAWDSCMFPKFTLHASGHNPRTTKQERYRQRVLHKYLYVKENVGSVACTGCGRCVRSCPAGMNIKGVVEQIREVFP